MALAQKESRHLKCQNNSPKTRENSMALDGWMDGWVGRWMEEKAGLRIAYSNQKFIVVSEGI